METKIKMMEMRKIYRRGKESIGRKKLVCQTHTHTHAHTPMVPSVSLNVSEAPFYVMKSRHYLPLPIFGHHESNTSIEQA